jgi:hypothetical protein
MTQAAIEATSDESALDRRSRALAELKALAKERRQRYRGPRRKNPDGRTWVMKRSRELAQMYAERLGAEAMADALTARNVERAATLAALAEDVLHRSLRGDIIARDDIIRTERLALMAEKALGLDRHKRPASRGLGAFIDEERKRGGT